MADAHGRYEQLAVGHVLGGLATHEAADFRTHLMSCPVCRRRVAELRDIAADLEAAELDERQRASVRTATSPHDGAADPEADPNRRTPPDPPQSAITVRHVTLAVVAVLLLAGAMAFWNLHLRTTVAVQDAVVEQDAQVLVTLASGVELDARFGEGLDGVVVLGDAQVAFSMVGVGDVSDRESIIGWLLDAEGEATTDSALLARPGQQGDDGLLRGVLETGIATQLVITREVGEVGELPQGDPLVEVDLTPGS